MTLESANLYNKFDMNRKTLRWINLIPFIIILMPVLVSVSCSMETTKHLLSSPDGTLTVHCRVSKDSLIYYRVDCRGEQVVMDSRLGIKREDADFTKNLVLDSVSGPSIVTENYELISGKKAHVQYNAREINFHLHNADQLRMDIVFRVSDDGLSFRYVFPGEPEEKLQIESECTEFHFPAGTNVFIQPMAAAKTGWSNTQPSYEEFYYEGVQLDSLPENEPGWVMPALLQTPGKWVLISETGVERNYCGGRLIHHPGENVLSLGFPQDEENFPGGPVKPQHTLPWVSPWRILAIGDLKTVTESTLGTDLARPTDYEDVSWIKPGRASWSWVLLKDDSIIYPVQKRFIDFAADMGWEYCLIDVDWDTRIGYEKIADLSDYAAEKDVGLILWYNSSGDWNTTVYHPKSRLLTREDRMAEFSRLKEMGICGIKVDFFGGDGSSMMDYYLDIFEDAAEFNLLVNCHGATLPRGWQRTYPNVMTLESVRGFEFVTFEQYNADMQPSHCCMLPFTRNVFDPMDFTPVCFSEVPRIRRLTNNAFELALSVIFWSGIQHYAEKPSGMQQVPDYVREFMMQVPCIWEEIHFIDGEPGKTVILARRSGQTWYVAGINGENREKPVSIPFDFLDGEVRGVLITDGDDPRSFRREEIEISPEKSLEMNIMSYGGFVIQIPQAGTDF